eukprot:scaffold26796_cov147-Cylindrotheca_fusiformis.AAC.2
MHEDRRIIMCTTAQYADDDKLQQPQRRQQMPQQLQEDLLLQNETDNCNLLILNDYNPISLEEEINALDPTIFWLVDDNAFRLRYYLRTSGLDGILNYKCGSSSDSSSRTTTTLNCLYIGENAGAVVAGASLATTAHAMHHGPKEAAPEPQYFGLGLLGPDRSVYYYYHDENSSQEEEEQQQQQNENDLSSILALKHDQIYVWSQPAAPAEKEEMTTTTSSSATSFIFLPSQRGAIEQWQYLPPVPPLVRMPIDNDGGVACHGEPSIDPSRVIQNGMADSEWITEVEDAATS